MPLKLLQIIFPLFFMVYILTSFLMYFSLILPHIYLCTYVHIVREEIQLAVHLISFSLFALLLIPFNSITAVMIPPSRPNITRLTDSSVMVRWGVPPNDGLPIQFFKVQYREMTKTGNGRRRGGSGARSRGPQGKGSRWMTSNEDIPPHIRSYEVDGLETDCTYRYIS
jgi:hypothetical protein